MGTVVALGGQVGGAKLADGLYRLRGKDLALIVNTGDDYEHLGLAFSPDLDTAVYTLAGMAGGEALRAQQRCGERLVAEQRLLGAAERFQHAV